MIFSFAILFLATALNAATLYVVNGLDESLGWINTQTLQHDAQAVSLGNIPNDVIATESRLFVVNSGLNTLQIIERQSLTTLDEIELAGTVNPWAAAVLDDHRVAVTGSVSGTVAIVNTSSGTIDTTFVTGTGPQSVVVHSDGLFVLNTGVQFPSYDNGQLMWYDKNTFALIDTFSVGVNAQFMEFAGDEVHIACTGDYGEIPGTIEIISLHNHAERTTIACGGTPGAISIFGRNAFVAAGGWGDAGSVFKYDVSSRSLLNGVNNPIDCGVGASDVQALTDGAFAVSCFSTADVEIRGPGGALIRTYEMSAGASTMCVWWDAMDDSPKRPEIATTIEFVNAYPNPFNGVVNFDVAGLRSFESALTIYDMTGRTVAKLPLGPGQQRVSWNARNGSGQEVAAGMYYVSLSGALSPSGTRIIYIK